MKKENAYEFRKKLTTVHTAIELEHRAAKENEFALRDGLKIRIAPNADEVIRTAALDFADFCKVSLQFSASVVTDGTADITVCLAEEAKVDLGEVASYRGFLIETDRDGIRIFGHDARGAAQALFCLEDQVGFAKAPLIPFGTIRKKPMFSPQMVHSSYGMDEYPEEYLMRIAHEGRDAIPIFVRAVNQVRDGHCDFNNLIHLAAKCGIDVYAYSDVKSMMHPEDPGAEEYYDGIYGTIFRECPGLKGVILVGESVAFPSRDPHVTFDRTPGDGIPTKKIHSGWYPCEDYPIWLNLVKKVIRKYRPDADIVFWTYNWGFQPEEARLKLIENLPTDISLEATFEMFEPMHYGTATGKCADYTLSFAGPGAYFTSEAQAAKKRGIPLYSMTNTGGMAWDFGVIPYEPMPYQWMKRYEAMRKAHDDWGLCGIMESHHYGFYPSFISKFSKYAFFEPREPMEDILKKVLCAEFGEENLANVDEAMRLYSEAIRYYTPSDADQYGAFRVGPSYPFWLSMPFMGMPANIPSDPKASAGNGICTPVYINLSDPQITPLALRIPEEIKFLHKMRECMEQGMVLLEQAPKKNEKLDELTNLCHFILNCTKTGLAVKEWHVLRARLDAATDKESFQSILDEMETAISEERKNVEDTIPLVEQDSRLGWEPSMLYMTDREHLEWKLRQLDYVQNIEIADFRKSLAL